MIQAILSYQFILTSGDWGILEPEFKPLKLIFNNKDLSQNNYQELIDMTDIFGIFYQHTTGISAEGAFSNLYIGRLKQTPYKAISHFTQTTSESQYITLLIFEMSDNIDRYEKEVELMGTKLNSIFDSHEGSDEPSMKWTKAKLIEYCKEKKIEVLPKFTKKVILAKIKSSKVKEEEELGKILNSTFEKLRNIKMINIFLSYSNKDSKRFQIPSITKELKSFPEINEVIYFEKEKYHNIFKFMNDNIEKCDVFLSFCSENAMKSKYVELEWQAALSKDKKVIPIFIRKDDIPALLAPFNGVSFDSEDLDMMIKEIYQIILKTLGIN